MNSSGIYFVESFILYQHEVPLCTETNYCMTVRYHHLYAGLTHFTENFVILRFSLLPLELGTRNIFIKILSSLPSISQIYLRPEITHETSSHNVAAHATSPCLLSVAVIGIMMPLDIDLINFMKDS